MAKEGEPKKKTKQSTAQKREIQNAKQRNRNKAFKSGVRTAIRHLEAAVTAGDTATVQERLNAVYGLMDKGVSKGIYKRNKAARTKSRLAARAAVKA